MMKFKLLLYYLLSIIQRNSEFKPIKSTIYTHLYPYMDFKNNAFLNKYDVFNISIKFLCQRKRCIIFTIKCDHFLKTNLKFVSIKNLDREFFIDPSECFHIIRLKRLFLAALLLIGGYQTVTVLINYGIHMQQIVTLYHTLQAFVDKEGTVITLENQ